MNIFLNSVNFSNKIIIIIYYYFVKNNITFYNFFNFLGKMGLNGPGGPGFSALHHDAMKLGAVSEREEVYRVLGRSVSLNLVRIGGRAFQPDLLLDR